MRCTLCRWRWRPETTHRHYASPLASRAVATSNIGPPGLCSDSASHKKKKIACRRPCPDVRSAKHKPSSIAASIASSRHSRRLDQPALLGIDDMIYRTAGAAAAQAGTGRACCGSTVRRTAASCHPPRDGYTNDTDLDVRFPRSRTFRAFIDSKYTSGSRIRFSDRFRTFATQEHFSCVCEVSSAVAIVVLGLVLPCPARDIYRY